MKRIAILICCLTIPFFTFSQENIKTDTSLLNQKGQTFYKEALLAKKDNEKIDLLNQALLHFQQSENGEMIINVKSN